MTTRPPPNPIDTALPPGVLDVNAIAARMSERAGREIKPATIRNYLHESRPQVGKRPGRYAQHPVPMPHRTSGRNLWWPETAGPEWDRWWDERPGQGHGKGRSGGRRKKEAQR